MINEELAAKPSLLMALVSAATRRAASASLGWPELFRLTYDDAEKRSSESRCNNQNAAL